MEAAVSMSAAHRAREAAAQNRSSTYMEHEMPREVRKATISPLMPQAKAGATRMPSGSPTQRLYGG